MDKIAQTISAEQMLSDLEVLVNAESPSRDIERLNIHAALLCQRDARCRDVPKLKLAHLVRLPNEDADRHQIRQLWGQYLSRAS